MTPFEVMAAAWLFLFGSCIGSFINVVIRRLPNNESLSKTRSHCPVCGADIRWRDLIPIAGWLILRGRCRDCGVRISPRYPLVELACALLAPLCFSRYGFDARVPLAFGVLAILLAIALIDLDTMQIPDRLIIALIPFAAGSVWAWGDTALLTRVIGFFAISAPMTLIALAIRDAFGGGDIKLMAVCGFLLGWQNALLAFFIALLIGGGYASFLIISKKRGRRSHIAFGPSLCTGVAAAMLFGTEITAFYLGLYGL
ncbi:MAG: prepilin peptidase [Oscillospiraceae bacterium]|nr:prepilin peptidase [Oscillospiraceae bacterium]